jgi:DNA-binding transcriptional ArsR family regulator
MDDGLKLQTLFQRLGDVNRLRIIRIIGNQTRSVSEIVEMTRLSQPLALHHLRVLKEQNILKIKQEGLFVYFLNKTRKQREYKSKCSKGRVIDSFRTKAG